MFTEKSREFIGKLSYEEVKGGFMISSILGGRPEDRVLLWMLDHKDQSAASDEIVTDTLLDREAVDQALSELEAQGLIRKAEETYELKLVPEGAEEYADDITGKIRDALISKMFRQFQEELVSWNKALEERLGEDQEEIVEDPEPTGFVLEGDMA